MKISPDIAQLLPLRAFEIELQFLEPSKPPFFHQIALTAFLRFLTGSPENYDQLIRIDVPESGRVRYRKGDHYRFVLTGLAGSDALLDQLLKGLAGLPQSAAKVIPTDPFRNNWRLVSVKDLFTHNEVHSLEDATFYNETTFLEEVALWADVSSFECLFQSPTRLLKETPAGKKQKTKGEARYVRNAPDLTSEVWFSRLHNSIADLLRRRGYQGKRVYDLPTLTPLATHIFWFDIEYKHKPTGGMCGRVTWELTTPLSPLYWQYLVIGQYIGVGQRATFGFGRYLLRTADKAQSCYRNVWASNSLIAQAQDEENLSKAWRHVMARRDLPEDQANTWTEADEALETFPLEELQHSLEEIFWDKYTYPSLNGYLIPKKQGGVRPLAIPPLYDRILQRAVQQVLNESLEPLMSHHSHGYRMGRSRITAAQAISKAWREGYHWVYEGDIRDFFDSVDWSLLYERLQAIFQYDPVVNALMSWVKQPVYFQEEYIDRKAGLPQGSPISPVLANLMLDDFDSDMEMAGFRMIRFADDFVVLCKKPEQAKQAQHQAEQSLQEHDLALHPDKSRIASMDDGFRYLGYLFVNDMVLDVSQTEPSALQESSTSTIPAHSWLAKLDEKAIEHAQSEQSLSKIIKNIQQKTALTVGQREKSGAFLTILGDPTVLSTLNRQLNVYRKDQSLYKIPWNSIESILLIGNHQITTQAMHAALESDVTIHLTNSFGQYKGCLTHNRNSQYQALWIKQTLCFQDADKALYCAKAIVLARIRHMKEVLRQRKQATQIPVINKALKTIPHTDTLEQLRGYEGSATREYYAKLSHLLAEEWEFNARNRYPPRDPFNVLLSLGYTQLYALVESVLHTKGLLPWQGFYHQPRGKHAALASDLMEPFRHLVERSALTMISRGELSVDDFSYTQAKACLLKDEAKRKYLSLLMQNWEIKVTALGGSEALTWLDHMNQQAESLKTFVLEGEAFQAFRLR